jgi:hypothetical protein
MASMQKISLLAGSAAIAAALVGIAPAQAEETPASMLDSANIADVEAEVLADGVSPATATDLEMTEQLEASEPAPLRCPLRLLTAASPWCSMSR